MSSSLPVVSPISQPYDYASSLTIAVSTKWHSYPDRFYWAAQQGFAFEYTPNPEAFSELRDHVDPFLKAGIPIRYHGFFPGYEIGHRDPMLAEQAMRIHVAALEAMSGRGEQVITVHIGITKGVPLDSGRVGENLARLVEYGKELGITISIENLKRGLASHPENIVNWAKQSGAMITLDIGHAVSSERVQNGDLTVQDIIAMYQDRLVEIHLYEQETDRHLAPQDMTILGPLVEHLFQTNCTWWTIELDDYEDILRTRTLLMEQALSWQSEARGSVCA